MPIGTPSPELVRAIINQQNYPAGSYRMMPSHGEQPDASWYREDGSLKGLGFLGPLKSGDSAVSEYSIADSEKLKDQNGNYIDYPTLVPTLTREEIQSVLKAAKNKSELPDSVYDKAEAFALQRKAQGLPLFARPHEANTSLYPDLQRMQSSPYILTNYNRMQPK